MAETKKFPAENLYVEHKDDREKPARERRRVYVAVTWEDDRQQAGRYWQFDRNLTEKDLIKAFRTAKAGKAWCNIWDNRKDQKNTEPVEKQDDNDDDWDASSALDFGDAA